MAERKELREVLVQTCDFCEDETKHLSKCAICEREGCGGEGGTRHFAYAIEIYEYGTGKRNVNGHICKECIAKNQTMALTKFTSSLLNR
ncbi:MAG: hypothetical protein PHC85_02380 [Candidatus Pacebacteria bacterium]|nr:hypothetical protein [Candidatus Paceibacterota bacterium]